MIWQFFGRFPSIASTAGVFTEQISKITAPGCTKEDISFTNCSIYHAGYQSSTKSQAAACSRDTHLAHTSIIFVFFPVLS
jgi:hypothetical protein